jgi:hypothetical protein
MTLVAEESAKSKAAKEVIKSLTAQVHINALALLSYIGFFRNEQNTSFSPEIIVKRILSYVAQGHG